MPNRFQYEAKKKSAPLAPRKVKTMKEKLKGLTPGRYDLDDLMELRAYATLLEVQYTETGVNKPAWLASAKATIDMEVKLKVKDELERRLSEARSRREALKTPDEKRNALDTEILALEASLA